MLFKPKDPNSELGQLITKEFAEARENEIPEIAKIFQSEAKKSGNTAAFLQGLTFPLEVLASALTDNDEATFCTRMTVITMLEAASLARREEL